MAELHEVLGSLNAIHQTSEVACSLQVELDQKLRDHLAFRNAKGLTHGLKLKGLETVLPPTSLQSVPQWQSYISLALGCEAAKVAVKDIRVELLNEANNQMSEMIDVLTEDVVLDLDDIRALFKHHNPAAAIFHCTLKTNIA